MEFDKIIKGPFDCHQTAMANVLSYYGYDYSYVALGKLLFWYDEKEKKVGNRIGNLLARRNPKRYELFGVERRTEKLPDAIDSVDYYISENIPVVIWADLYNCSWNDAYKKYHFGHCYIAYRKLKDDTYIIFDPYFDKREVIQSREELLDIATRYTVYIKKDSSDNKIEEICNEISRDAIYYFENDMPNNILKFGKALSQVDLVEECDYPNTDIYAIPLLDNLKIICEQRKSYAMLLAYIGGNTEDKWIEAQEKLEKSAKYWEKMRIYIIKMLIKRNKFCDNAVISEYVKEIKNLETEAIKILL